jgi:hypothetical protein
MKKKLTERELAKQIIPKLKTGNYSGICVLLLIMVDDRDGDYLERHLPKLYKHLSKRRNFHYINGNDCIGRKMGIGEHCYLWKPYNSAPRIKILKQVYNIK